MNRLVKLYDGFYMAKGNAGSYTLSKGGIGVYSAGNCYRLKLEDKVIACFVTKSDFHSCENEYSVNSKLWTLNDLVDKANEIIESVEAMN